MTEEEEIKTWENKRGDVITPRYHQISDKCVCITDYFIYT
jgi:hypothetical protein